MAEQGVIRRGLGVLWLGVREEPRIFAISAAGSALFGGMTIAQAYVFGYVTSHVITPSVERGDARPALLAGAVLLIAGVATLKVLGILARRLGAGVMVGWMDDQALHLTLTTGRCTYWSRSRQEYWVKGETSGSQQWVKSVALDCDGDTLLVKVDQVGGACHTGDRTCFDAVVLPAVLGERPWARRTPGGRRSTSRGCGCSAPRSSR